MVPRHPWPNLAWSCVAHLKMEKNSIKRIIIQTQIRTKVPAYQIKIDWTNVNKELIMTVLDSISTMSKLNKLAEKFIHHTRMPNNISTVLYIQGKY